MNLEDIRAAHLLLCSTANLDRIAARLHNDPAEILRGHQALNMRPLASFTTDYLTDMPRLSFNGLGFRARNMWSNWVDESR